jgi:hypothetical protein
VSSGLNGRVHHEKRVGTTTLGAASMHCSHDPASNLKQYCDGLERARTLEFFGANLLQDRRPEFYGLLAESTL